MKSVKGFFTGAISKAKAKEQKQAVKDGWNAHKAEAVNIQAEKDAKTGKPDEAEKKAGEPDVEWDTENGAKTKEPDKQGVKGEKTPEEKAKKEKEAEQLEKEIADYKRSLAEKLSDLDAQKTQTIAEINSNPDTTDAQKKKATQDTEKQFKELEEETKKRYHKDMKESHKRLSEHEKEHGPSVRHEHPVVAYTFWVSLIALGISLGFEVPAIFRTIVVGILVVAGVAYIIYKRKAADKKTSKKFIASMIILVILVVSLLPGLICDYLSGVPVLSYSCAIEESISGPVRGMVGSTVGTVYTGAKNWFFGFMRNLVPNNPLLKNLKVQSCYPFCTDPTGKDTTWHGLELTRLEMLPHTIYSHQQFSIVVEFENKGKTPATFTPPIPRQGGDMPSFFERLKELFGFAGDKEFDGGLTLMCKRQCKFDFGLGRWIGETFGGGSQTEATPEGGVGVSNADAGCEKICPLNAATIEKPYVVGGCINEILNTEGNVIPDKKCTLEPGDILRMTWYGLTVNKGTAIEMGAKIKPETQMGLQYTYTPGNDLIGTISMMSAETQVAGAEQKSIGRIANQISQSYSPTGPLMMALGTAETQVVFGSPMFFMVQFTNKGKGTIPTISPKYQLLYLPESFKIRSSSCDFKEVTPEESSSLFTYEGHTCADWRTPDCADWYPGPNFATGYKAYQPKEKIQTVGKGQDPMYNPMYACVINTPTSRALSSYVTKYRVLEYAYQEEYAADITIIGTEISAQAEAPPEGEGVVTGGEGPGATT